MATETDIQIGAEQQRKLRELAESNGRSAGDVANDAVDAYYGTRMAAAASRPVDGFFANPTLDELAAAQNVRPISNVSELRAAFWPPDESADQFLDARRVWRQNG